MSDYVRQAGKIQVLKDKTYVYYREACSRLVNEGQGGVSQQENSRVGQPGTLFTSLQSANLEQCYIYLHGR